MASPSTQLATVPPQYATRGGIQVDSRYLTQIEQLAAQFGLKVNSGYRDAAHNAEVGGASGSDHLSGDAVDFTGPASAMQALYSYAQGKFPYVEPWSQTGGSHVHISFARSGGGSVSMASPPTTPAPEQFVADVSKATQIDPRVLIAWAQQEGAYAKGGTGGFNYLNLRPIAGDPYSSVSSGGFEQFSSLSDAEAATIRRLGQPFAQPIITAAGQHVSSLATPATSGLTTRA